MRKFLIAAACWAMIDFANARADVDYRYITDKTFYLVAPGNKATVSIYLQETVTGNSTSRIFSDGGLFGAAVMVTRVDGTGTIYGSPISGLNDFKIAGNVAPSPAGFGPIPTIQEQIPATPTQAGLVINADVPGGVADGPKFSSGGPGIRTILLGTVNVSGGNFSTTYRVTTYGGASNTITQTGTDLDFGTQVLNGYTGAAVSPLGAYSFIVSVPEPGSVSLCGLLTCGVCVAGYRRRKPTISESSGAA